MFQQILFVLLQSALMAAAAPVTAAQHNDMLGYHVGGGVFGFVVLVIDIIIWIEVLKSSRPVPNKILWALLVFIFPIIGAIVYFLFSERKAHKGGYEVIP